MTFNILLSERSLLRENFKNDRENLRDQREEKKFPADGADERRSNPSNEHQDDEIKFSMTFLYTSFEKKPVKRTFQNDLRKSA